MHQPRAGKRLAWSLACARFPAGNPSGNARVQQIEWQRARIQNLVVKSLDIEPRSQFVLCPLPQLQNFQLSDLVSQRLPRQHDIAVDLGLQRVSKMLLKIIGHLLTRPVLVAHTAVYDESDGAEQFALKTSQVARRILIKAHLFAKPLGVERPSLQVGVVEDRKMERMSVGQFLRN